MIGEFGDRVHLNGQAAAFNDGVTIVMPYYDNGGMLLQHLAAWEDYPAALRDRVKVIVVDDGSPKAPAVEVLRAAGYRDRDAGGAGLPVPLNLRIYRIKTDIPWNQDGARNLAMKRTDTVWAFMTDMDHLLPASQIAPLLALDAQPRRMYMPVQYLTDGTSLGRPHPNSFLLRVADFWGMGGYDEDFAGWYGSDGNFRRCAKFAGLVEQPTTAFHTVVYRPRDCFDANTKAYGRKNSSFHVPNNRELFKKARGKPYKATNPIRFEWERVF